MSLERPLRLLTFLATAIAVPITIAATVVSMEHELYHHYWYSHRSVTAFCFAFIPLAMTVFTSTVCLQYTKKHGKSPHALAYKALDIISAITYLGVLIPCWAIEIDEFNSGAFGLLVGYTTAPMFLNMCLHIFFALNGLPWKQWFSKIPSFGPSRSCQQCPNCQAKFISGTTETTTKKGYSLLRGEEYLDVEADPIQYRDSEDFLGEGAERAEQAEQVEQPKDSGKGKDMMEV